MIAIIAHEVPLRLRFRVQRLKHDGRHAERLSGCIAAVPGVARACASPLTGSLTVTHDGEAATRELIIKALEACGHRALPAAAVPAAAIRFSGAATVGYPLLRILAEALVERLLHTAIAAVV